MRTYRLLLEDMTFDDVVDTDHEIEIDDEKDIENLTSPLGAQELAENIQLAIKKDLKGYFARKI